MIRGKKRKTESKERKKLRALESFKELRRGRTKQNLNGNIQYR